MCVLTASGLSTTRSWFEEENVWGEGWGSITVAGDPSDLARSGHTPSHSLIPIHSQ